MEHKNKTPNQKPYPPILFIDAEHIMKLLSRCRSTANDHLKEMRKRYNIRKPGKVTLEIACDYFTITKKQFYRKYYGW